MLRSVNQILGYSLDARDGRFGKVEDFYFDDYVWRVRYLVASTGGWLNRKAVLISPAAVESPRSSEAAIPLRLTQDQVRNSPDIDTEKPVSRQMEATMSAYYGWPTYWPEEPLPETAAAPGAHEPARDPHLRSMREVCGYMVRGLDQKEAAGEVVDFLVDDGDWTVRYIVVREAGERKRELILNPWWTREIDWANRTMSFELPVAQILSSPGFDAQSPVDRGYEEVLHEHYRRPPYWHREHNVQKDKVQK